VEKSIDYYMNLPYTVELESSGDGYRASIKELPACMATVGPSGTVEELWRLLKEAQRGWIEQQLRWDGEVPEPPAADLFWESLPDDLDGDEVRSMLYALGANYVPLRVLQELWAQELGEVGLGEVGPSPGVPPKAGTSHHNHIPPTPEEDVRPVHLGKSRKAAWIRLDGPRTERGYRNIEVLDQPLRTDAAIVAALTVLEASVIRDADFEQLRRALLDHVEARRELEQKKLQEVLDGLPPRWFSERKTDIDEEIKRLSPEERKKRLPKSWRSWERAPLLWERSIRYMVALLRYRRPDFDRHVLEEQLDLLDRHWRHINKFLVKQREHIKFLEYGTPKGTPRAVDLAQDQVKAAVLADIEGLSHKEIANRLGVDVPDRYEINAKIPKITDLVRDGRALLDEVLGEIEWREHAEGMKAEGERYRSLSEEGKEIERLAENLGWTVKRARLLYQTNPGAAKFLAHAY
jgi:predicted RNase H-like HicB family nuclease